MKTYVCYDGQVKSIPALIILMSMDSEKDSTALFTMGVAEGMEHDKGVIRMDELFNAMMVALGYVDGSYEDNLKAIGLDVFDKAKSLYEGGCIVRAEDKDEAKRFYEAYMKDMIHE